MSAAVWRRPTPLTPPAIAGSLLRPAHVSSGCAVSRGPETIRAFLREFDNRLPGGAAKLVDAWTRRAE